jgi:ribosomal protein S15P/S13E
MSGWDGSPEVQIVIISERIGHHFKTHQKEKRATMRVVAFFCQRDA